MMGTFLGISINNILLTVWLYCLVLEPRFGRGGTVFLCAVWFAVLEAFGWATLDWTQGAPFLLFAFGFCLVVGYHLGACVLLSRAKPLKVTFLYFTFFQNVWTAVFILQNMLSWDALTWNLVSLALNAIILPPFVLYLKRYYLRVCREVESGYGLAASVAALEFFVMSVILLHTPYEREFSPQKVIFLLSLLILAAVVHILLFRLLVQMDQQKQLKHMELQGRILLSQIEAYEQMEQAVLRRNHDSRHHLTALEELLMRGDSAGALNYLKQSEAQLQAGDLPAGAGRVCENRMVNTIVSAYMRRFHQAGATLQADITLGPGTSVSDMDFVVILANILENALHATQDTPGRDIRLHIVRKGRKLVITCVNPCRGDIMFEDGLPVASQPERRGAGQSGIGIKSILHTAKKYSGDANFSLVPQDGSSMTEFKCVVVLDDPL